MRFKRLLILVLFLLSICLTIVPKAVAQYPLSCPESQIYNDEYICHQWNLRGINWFNLRGAERFHQYGKNVRVAFVDTGGEPLKDIRRRFVEGKDFVDGEFITSAKKSKDEDNRRHGTIVILIAGAKANNKYLIAGIAPNIDIMSLRIVRHSHQIVPLNRMINAIDFAVKNDADIINISMAPTSISENFSLEPLKKAINKANQSNVLIVFASGNRKQIGEKFPGVMKELQKLPNVIVVTAHNSDRTFSDYANEVGDLSAPVGGSIFNQKQDFGDKIVAKVKAVFKTDGLYIPIFSKNSLSQPGVEQKKYDPYYMGTSFAAPQVTGAAAIVLRVIQSCDGGIHAKDCQIPYTPADIKNILIKSGTPNPITRIPMLNVEQADLEASKYVSKRASKSYPVPDPPVAEENTPHNELLEKLKRFILENPILVLCTVILTLFLFLTKFPFISGTTIYTISGSVLLHQVNAFDILSYIAEITILVVPTILVVLLLQNQFWLSFVKGAFLGSALCLFAFSIINFRVGKVAHFSSCGILCLLSIGLLLYLHKNWSLD